VPTNQAQKLNSASTRPSNRSTILNTYLARIEAKTIPASPRRSAQRRGFVSECTVRKYFHRQRPQADDPAASAGAIYGVTSEASHGTRDQMGLAVLEPNLHALRIYLTATRTASLTARVRKSFPVGKIDGRVIGAGKPGHVHKRMVRLPRLTKPPGADIRLVMCAVL